MIFAFFSKFVNFLPIDLKIGTQIDWTYTMYHTNKNMQPWSAKKIVAEPEIYDSYRHIAVCVFKTPAPLVKQIIRSNKNHWIITNICGNNYRYNCGWRRY